MLRKVINLKEGLKLTCGARARSVGAREVVECGNDVGRRGESARDRGGAIGAGRGDDESLRAGRCWKADDGVWGRFWAAWAGSGRSGPVWTGLGCPGPVWTVVGRFGRSGPVPVWLDGPRGLDRSGSGRSGPAGTGLGLGEGPGRSGWDRPARSFLVTAGPG